MRVEWSHCVLKVRDLEAMVAFYCDLFGWRVSDRGPVGSSVDIVFLSGSSTDHHQMALMPTRGEEEGTSLDHNAFRVESLDDVLRTHAWVTADDRASDPFPVTHGNAISVYFSDPEDNGIEVFCDTPWHVKQPQLKGWDPSLTAEEILAAVKTAFEDAPEFMPMEEYRARQAVAFGET